MPSVKKDNPSALFRVSKDKKDREFMRLAFTIFAEATSWIAFPVIGALFLGRWLDEKQGTEPLYFLSMTAAAFIISSVGIGITGVKYMKRIEAEDFKKKSKDLTKGDLGRLKKDENESRGK